MAGSPRISVVMSVYNGERHLEEAVASILNQSFSDFEFIIINDGSTDRTVEIIESFSDSRIRLIHNDGNIGLTKSLNKGIELSNGEFIARMDADDISLPERFKKQIDFLDAHPEIGITGTNVRAIGENSKPKYKIKYPENHWLIYWSLLFSNPMCHPSVMIRKEVLNKYGNYNSQLKSSQDFELWSRLIGQTKFHNLQGIHLLLRTKGEKISLINFNNQLSSAIDINHNHLSVFLNKEINIELIRGLWTWKFRNSHDVKSMVEIILNTIQKFVKDFNLSGDIKKQIKKDAARRILLITATKFYSPVLLSSYIKATKLSFFSPFTTFIYGLNTIINKYLRN